MKPVHTPGPWRIADDSKLDPSIWHHLPAIEGARGNMVASIAMSGPKGIANARLIAAAPELLAALQHALATEQAHGQDWQPWAQAARAAIAKAMP